MIRKGGLKISGSLFYLGVPFANIFRKWNVLFTLGFELCAFGLTDPRSHVFFSATGFC
ncbi:hypothetical protein LEP1GSC036_4438 [Leptospira weilii str. 2006001853]|uniref:Uncharacterized protein n=1 Tax=Leptospira weilii str. 2006001853 TaxID=1001589 RepID=A0A828Z1E0_9LEPT|nr:hypothetical protein LEP1GSC036_4438 [Leptospira weilii str. 2006001853]EMJ63176.1 hypothetical protein LEP1GSC051_1168 [Leptospira sp. P2653]